MPRFIETTDALRVLSEYYNYRTDAENYRLALAISKVPTADVVEVKHGEWVKMSDADGVYWACSECGENIPRVSHYDPQFDLFPRLESIEKTNFCPNCGAKMRKGTEDGEIH